MLISLLLLQQIYVKKKQIRSLQITAQFTSSLTWKSSKSDKNEYAHNDSKKKKRPFTLDVTRLDTNDAEKLKGTSKQGRKFSPSRDLLKVIDKPKRSKVRTRSPMSHRKSTKKSPQKVTDDEYWLGSGNVEIDGKPSVVTSDESSSGICGEKKKELTMSPRKNKKLRESSRRKSTPRSPTVSSKGRRRSSSIDDKPSSLPGSLPRRKSSQSRLDLEELQKNRLSPHRYGVPRFS